MSPQLSEQNNFTYLTVALVVLLLAGALVDQYLGSEGVRIISAATILTLAVGVWSIRFKKRWFHTGIGFVVAIMLVTIATLFLDLVGLQYAQLLIMLAFFCMTAWVAAKQVLFTGQIDANKIIGAICIFLLLGLIWLVIYLLMVEVEPLSFNGLQAGPWYENFTELAYFSFVSLTTLGYGDITPALPVSRFLAYIEAITGMFYIAILVASLVGAGISERGTKTKPRG